MQQSDFISAAELSQLPATRSTPSIGSKRRTFELSQKRTSELGCYTRNTGNKHYGNSDILDALRTLRWLVNCPRHPPILGHGRSRGRHSGGKKLITLWCST